MTATHDFQTLAEELAEGDVPEGQTAAAREELARLFPIVQVEALERMSGTVEVLTSTIAATLNQLLVVLQSLDNRAMNGLRVKVEGPDQFGINTQPIKVST